MADIKENLSEITSRIRAAAESSGRTDPITLIAVSKTKPIAALEEAHLAGAADFGENYVQELTEKLDHFLPKAADGSLPPVRPDLRFHMIGHLQTNKIRYIIGRVAMIHSVDSLKLAEAIEKEAAKRDLVQDILIEVNIAEESSKTGTTAADALEIIRTAAKLPHIRIRGLMCMPPITEDPENSRPYFSQLRALRDEVIAMHLDNVTMDYLSMGTTGDFETAIQEGANMIRVGTAIFGHRDYSPRA